MFRVCIGLLMISFSLIGCQSLAFALEKPTTPTKPQAPSPIDPPSEVSGDFEVPQKPGLRVRVFAHPQRPTPPPKPGATNSPSPSTSPSPSPTVSPSPVATSNPALACNLTDPDSLTTANPTGWHLNLGNITYRLNLRSVPSTVGGANLNTIVSAGFNQLSQATGGKVNFVRGADTSVNRSRLDSQNIIAWNRLSSGTLGTTYVWYYPSTGAVVEVDTIMNNRYKWTWSNSNFCAETTTYDAQNIMTHELGHWMGLDDHYDNIHKDLTMYGYGAIKEVKKNTLTTGDKSGISNIYSPL